MTTQVHIISHNDLDGVGSVMVLDYGFSGNSVYKVGSAVMIGNHQVDDTVLRTLQELSARKDNHLIIMVDLSPSFEVAQIIDKTLKKNPNIEFALLDHHKTALDLNMYDWAKVEVCNEYGINLSGSSLAVDFLYSKGITLSPVMYDFAEQVRLYDTWDWHKEGLTLPKELNDLLYMIGRSDFMSSVMTHILKADLSDETSFTIPRQYELLLEIENERIEAYVSKKEKQLVLREMSFIYNNEVRKATLGVVFAEQYQSELGNKLCERNPHIDLVAMVDLGSRKVSLRTVSDIVDVSVIAKANGGGGHKSAAGFPLNDDILQEWIVF